MVRYFPSNISLRDSDTSLNGNDISPSCSDISLSTNEISLSDSDISFGENDISTSCSDILRSENDISLSENEISLRANDNYRRAQRYIATVRTITSRRDSCFAIYRAIYRFKQNIVQKSPITRDYPDFRRISFALLLHNNVYTCFVC